MAAMRGPGGPSVAATLGPGGPIMGRPSTGYAFCVNPLGPYPINLIIIIIK